MANPALSDIRTNIAKLITAKYKTGTPSSVGVATLADLLVLDLHPNGYFIGNYLLDSAGQAFFITNSVQSGGTLTVQPGGTPGAGVYEIYLVHPDLIKDAINRQVRLGFPLLNRWYITEAQVTNSPVADPGFEDWSSSSALRAWQVATATLSRQSADPLYGGFNARCGTMAGYLEPKAEFQTDLWCLRGSTPTVYAWAKTASASSARIQFRATAITGVVTTTNGTYHTGGGGWELLSVVAAAIPSDAITINFRLLNDVATSTDWDNVWIEGGPTLYSYRLPQPLIEGPSDVLISQIEDRNFVRRERWSRWPFQSRLAREDEPSGNNRYMLEFAKAPPPGYRMRVEGPAILQTLSADADILLIADKEQIVLEHRAALDVLDNLGNQIAATSVGFLESTKATLRNRLVRAERDIRAPNRGGSLNFDV